MTPRSTPLPVLPLPSSFPILPVPLLGHKDERAVRVLRVLASAHAARTLDLAFVRRKVGDVNGTVTIVGTEHKLFVAAFGDGTFFIGALLGDEAHAFFEPFIGVGTGDARTAFKTLTDHQRADVHRTVLDAPDLALMSADLLLEGRHWPRWAALNGAQAANRSGAFPRPSTLDAWWWRIVHSLPAPIIPPVRTPAPTEPFSLVFRITGRTLLREGVGALSVHIPNPTFSLSNKAWVEKAVETAQRVFSSPNVLPPWASMAQTLATVQGTQRIAALPIYTGKAVLDHDGVSAHQRLALLSSLSDSALMAA